MMIIAPALFAAQMDKTDAHVHQLIDSGQSPARNLVRRPMADLLTFVLVPSAFLLKVFSILRYVGLNEVHVDYCCSNCHPSLPLSLEVS